MKTVQWIVFSLLVVAQLAVPYSMIATREQTLLEGVAYKFRCGPVDPYDYFRGRYVALSFPDAALEDYRGPAFTKREKAYALLGTDASGFATIVDVRLKPPASGDYLEVTARGGGAAGAWLWVGLPFNRYYMNERDAPEAERAYRATSRSEREAHVIVRVRAGHGVLDGLFIEDIPIETFLKNEVDASVDGEGSP